MISFPFRRPDTRPNINALYGMIVAQARFPAFYRSYGVADTVIGRLEMIMLHLVLVLRQLSAGGAMPPQGQALFDHFCRDMDDNLREMGVGDLTVPKEMQRVAEAFYGRSRAYDEAFAAEGATALEMAVARNVFGLGEPDVGARRLVAYIREAARRLQEHGSTALLRGEADFPDPDAVPEAGPKTV